MKSIYLGPEVIVSDPCYTIPTWCQARVTDVLEGMYKTNVFKMYDHDWGTRCSYLVAIHQNYCHQDEKFKWTEYPATIGVDSGQAGIFSKESYRNDDHQIDIEPYDFRGNFDDSDPGEIWYRKMCSMTLSEDSFGSYNQGIVSSSGIGDGSYPLLVARKKGKIVGFIIDFFMEKKPYKKLIYEEFLTRI